MDMSDKTDQLFPALVKMQAAVSNAYKSSQGHGYVFADLAQCINTAKPHLESNGLAVTQLLGDGGNGTMLTTMMVHESGQWLRSEFTMERATLQGGAGKNPAQVMGAGITYMRRYSYAAIIGMAQTDDDAACVSQQPRQSLGVMPSRDELIKRMTNKVEGEGKTLENFINWIGGTLKREISGFSDISGQELEQFARKMGLIS